MNGQKSTATGSGRWVAISTGVGVAVPCLWLLFHWMVLRGNPGLIDSIMETFHFDRVLLAIWPSWILLLADPEEKSVAIPVVSVVVNAALYGIVGWLLWFGFYRHRTVLGLVIAAIAGGWFFLLSWYTGA